VTVNPLEPLLKVRVWASTGPSLVCGGLAKAQLLEAALSWLLLPADMAGIVYSGSRKKKTSFRYQSMIIANTR